MSDVRKSEKIEVALGLGSSVMQASSEATRRLLAQGQTFVGAMVEWNSEISQFFSRRIARNSEAFTRLTKCQGFPDAFAIQAQWIQDAADDYSKEIQKFIEVNGKMVTQASGLGGHLQTRSAPSRSSLRAAE
jgi:hypothetical protein